MEPSIASKNVFWHWYQDPDSEATYYLILRSVDRFYSEFSALPGALADQVICHTCSSVLSVIFLRLSRMKCI